MPFQAKDQAGIAIFKGFMGLSGIVITAAPELCR